MSDPLAECLAGRISPQVAVTRLLLGGADAASLAGLAAERADPANPHWRALRDLVESRAASLVHMAWVLRGAGFDHGLRALDSARAVAEVGAAFDRLAEASPELGVAAYSLGIPALLDAATEEVKDWILARGLAGRESRVLDLGCGIGRIAAALAPECAGVLGLDVSVAMVAQAKARCGAVANLLFEVTSGEDLASLPDAAFDLFLAVDSFPYLLLAGDAVAERHVADAARLLRAGGALAILNLSYEGPQADLVRARAWAAGHHFALEVCAERPFRIWDATAFVLRKPQAG